MVFRWVWLAGRGRTEGYDWRSETEDKWVSEEEDGRERQKATEIGNRDSATIHAAASQSASQQEYLNLRLPIRMWRVNV